MKKKTLTPRQKITLWANRCPKATEIQTAGIWYTQDRSPRSAPIVAPRNRRVAVLGFVLAIFSCSSSAFEMNNASTTELMSISGIGPKTAAKIEAARSEKPFVSCIDMQKRVKGIGPKKRATVEAEHTCGS